jgi:mono/diheme cytochrome c family protein
MQKADCTGPLKFHKVPQGEVGRVNRMTRCVSRVSAVVAAITVIGIYLASVASDQATAAALASDLQRSPAAPKAASAQKNPIPTSESSVRAGRAVYARICRACHGLQGKGDGVSAPPGAKPANLVDAEWKYGGSDSEIFKTIKEGVKPYDVMEPWGKKLSDTEIWHTVNFLRDLAKPKK